MIRLWNGMRMTEKCKKTEYARRSFEGLAPLTKEAMTIVRPILGKRGFVGIDILSEWENIVGSDLARGIFPEKLVFDRDKRSDGTLHVKSSGGAFAMLFEHQKAKVIERINTFFGYPAVAHIKIKQGAFQLAQKASLTKRSLTDSEIADLNRRIAQIEDPALREQAYQIGAEILIKNGSG